MTKTLVSLVLLLIGMQVAGAFMAHGAYRQYQADRVADLEARQAVQQQILATNLDLLTYPDDEVDLSVLNAWDKLRHDYVLWATEDLNPPTDSSGQ